MSDIGRPQESKSRGEDLNDTEFDEHSHTIEQDESQSLRRETFPSRESLDPLDYSMIKQQELLRRRTGGILTGVNIVHADRERSNINSLKKIAGDGNIREANFASLKRQPKRTRMFKELLVTGNFKEIEHEIEDQTTQETVYDIDEEDILEYQLFNSIDKWSRRVTGFLNLFSGVIVGMFVVNVMIISAVNDVAMFSISLYFAQLFTFFVNLCVVFSIAETLISYDKYIRLRDHFHPDTVKFQGYFIISLVTSVVFML